MTGPDRCSEVLRYAAFTEDPGGGNPAGVVLDATGHVDESMLALAAQLGYSATAFVTQGAAPDGGLRVRYFSPEVEVPFCGHATIATAVAWAERHGTGQLELYTRAGLVRVQTRKGPEGLTATLTSVAPHVAAANAADVVEALAALCWAPDDLDPMLPPRLAYAGAHHLVLAARTRRRLAELDYDFSRLRALMEARDWTTLQIVWRERTHTYHARNPFPPGGVVEDPATGTAAAAFGAYLRALRVLKPPARITIHQGHDLGRPSHLTVDILPGADTGIRVTGRAVVLS